MSIDLANFDLNPIEFDPTYEDFAEDLLDDEDEYPFVTEVDEWATGYGEDDDDFLGYIDDDEDDDA